MSNNVHIHWIQPESVETPSEKADRRIAEIMPARSLTDKPAEQWRICGTDRHVTWNTITVGNREDVQKKADRWNKESTYKYYWIRPCSDGTDQAPAPPEVNWAGDPIKTQQQPEKPPELWRIWRQAVGNEVLHKTDHVGLPAEIIGQLLRLRVVGATFNYFAFEEHEQLAPPPVQPRPDRWRLIVRDKSSNCRDWTITECGGEQDRMQKIADKWNAEYPQSHYQIMPEDVLILSAQGFH